MPAEWEKHEVIGYGSSNLTLRQLLDGWQSRIGRFEQELDKGIEDHTVWNADDFAGALHLRDAIDNGVSQLSALQRVGAESAVDEIDSTFRAMTESDDKMLLLWYLFLEEEERGWWWSRIPKSGPVRQQVDAALTLRNRLSIPDGHLPSRVERLVAVIQETAMKFDGSVSSLSDVVPRLNASITVLEDWEPAAWVREVRGDWERLRQVCAVVLAEGRTAFSEDEARQVQSILQKLRSLSRTR